MTGSGVVSRSNELSAGHNDQASAAMDAHVALFLTRGGSLSGWQHKVLLEAMACRLPIIGTRVTGITYVLAHGRTGYLCEPSVARTRAALAVEDELRILEKLSQ